MMSSGEENPSSFPLVVGAERVREEGHGAPIPGTFHAERSSDNSRRSSGATSFLHQWAKVGQKKKVHLFPVVILQETGCRQVQA